jgi:hypothetical protein
MAKRKTKKTTKKKSPRFPRAGSPVNRTEAALTGRGVDKGTAARLRAANWTLAKLKGAPLAKLKGLGLSAFAIAGLRMGARSEIPFDDLAAVLIANRFTCCVCHDTPKSIIVHHIDEWAKSHDHSPRNLAVLCLDDHDEAHTRRELSRNLTPALLRSAKQAWEAEVRKLDVTAILDASRAQSSAWLYFNHARLFELAKSLNVRLSALEHYSAASAHGVIKATGLPALRPKSRPWMYNGGDGVPLYLYVRDVLHAVLEHLSVFNLSDYLDRGLLLPLVKPGDFILVQGVHQFSPKNKKAKGTDQPAQGRRRANHVEVRFEFNLFEATSSSAYNLWLRGRHTATSIVRLGTIDQANGKLTLVGTVMGVAQGFGQLKTRDYLPQRPVSSRRRKKIIQI